MLNKLKALNEIPVYDVHDAAFAPYGRILSGYAFDELFPYMTERTEIPQEGNIYVPSVSEMEDAAVAKTVRNTLYGGMPVQIGYCNGKNSSMNGFEYHKCSEINVAVTDQVLMLGHIWEISDNRYQVKDARAFYVAAGVAIEMYATTLHLAPCKVTDEGFKTVVILPLGTNTELERACDCAGDPEQTLLLMKNKWVIAHPQRKQLIDKGAFPGLIGDNLELIYH